MTTARHREELIWNLIILHMILKALDNRNIQIHHETKDELVKLHAGRAEVIFKCSVLPVTKVMRDMKGENEKALTVRQ